MIATTARLRRKPVAMPTPPAPAEPLPAAPSPFDNYEAIKTPEAAYWDDRGYMKWQLETCQAGSRLSHSRNRAYPTT
jgi:hypothetical protein